MFWQPIPVRRLRWSRPPSDSFIGKKDGIAVFLSPTIVTILSQSIYETVSIDIHEICFIKSDGNYIEIYRCENDTAQKRIIRNTLKEIEKQLSGYTCIIKTHRSHLVNINQIRSVKGNAQGYTIYFKNCSNTIPVSRNHINRFDEAIKELSLWFFLFICHTSHIQSIHHIIFFS